MKEEEATRCNINPDVATVITAAKRCPLCLESKVSICTSLRKTGNFCHMFSAKARESVYFRHMDAAKEKPCIAKGSRKRRRKGRQNRTQSIGGSATAHLKIMGFNGCIFVYVRLSSFVPIRTPQWMCVLLLSLAVLV